MLTSDSNQDTKTNENNKHKKSNHTQAVGFVADEKKQLRNGSKNKDNDSINASAT